MTPPIHLGNLMARPLDRHVRGAARAERRAPERRLAAVPARRSGPAVTVRRLPATAPEVARLAMLDGYGAPTGDWLVAEVGGTAVAAVPLSGAAPLPDPFGSEVGQVVPLRARAAAAQAATQAPSRLPQQLAVAASAAG